MSDVAPSLIKYIYLDVVGFTYNRSVEAQTDIVSSLNGIVRHVVSRKISEEHIIYIPVGDGICICILKSTKYDGYIQIAEDIIRRIVSIHNKAAITTRKFEVRIGINENIDNIITDINGNKNVCGAGINYAQRIMSFADASQILVGHTTYESLHHREKYSRAFRGYRAKAKHDTTLDLYQYIGGSVAGLNRSVPSSFSSPDIELSKYDAYYLAHAIKNRQFIDDNLQHNYDLYPMGLILTYLAEDSVGNSTSTKINPYDNRMPKTENNTLAEQFEVLSNIPFSILLDLFNAKVYYGIFPKHRNCFEADSWGLFVNSKGEQKLKSQWPNICDEFSL